MVLSCDLQPGVVQKRETIEGEAGDFYRVDHFI